MRTALDRARLIIYHGSMLTAEETLLAGRPQVVVPLYLEHLLTARALEGLGVGMAVPATASPNVIEAKAWRTRRRRSRVPRGRRPTPERCSERCSHPARRSGPIPRPPRLADPASGIVFGMESSPGSEIAQLERQLNELRAGAANAGAEAETAEDALRLRAAVTGRMGRGWTPVAVGIGLAVAAALALPVESLFTTPRMAPDCRTPVPRAKAMRAFDRAFHSPAPGSPER